MKDQKYKRCVLVNDKEKKVVWIPSGAARKGRKMQLEDGDIWMITLVCPERLTEKEIRKQK